MLTTSHRPCFLHNLCYYSYLVPLTRTAVGTVTSPLPKLCSSVFSETIPERQKYLVSKLICVDLWHGMILNIDHDAPGAEGPSNA